MEMKIKCLRGTKPPFYATNGAAGLDLVAAIDKEMQLEPAKRVMVPTGIAVAIPEGYVGLVYARSGLSTRQGITLTNCVGVIDSDYRGEIVCSLIHLGQEPYTIRPGDRIAQLVLTPAPQAALHVVEVLPQTERGEGGFGSTGK
ncbi:MAG: dUTP diphosphatase [Clostridia bacterium]|nr:dUTP diphosphatase [Clostridia bacterium]